MHKQNILALALKPAMRATKSVRIGIVLLLTTALIAIITPSAVSAPPPCEEPTATLLVTGLQGASGSTIGPDGALYVTEGAIGGISRVDPQTGEKTTFASGLPRAIIGIGGAIDVAFIDRTAYVLVTLVDPDVGGSNVDGIYRVDGPDSFTIVADIGDFNINNPPTIPFPFFIPTGVQYALQTFRGGFLVTDGHLNRVLRVTLDGEISALIAFDDIVPTGLAVSGNTITWPRPAPSPTWPRTARLWRSGRSRPLPRRWPPAPPSSSTWNLAAVVVSTRSRRGRGCRAPLRVLRRSRTAARS
jgi:hypothetical protein